MNKITLLTASALVLAGVGLSTGAQLAHADVASPNVALQAPTANPSPRITILDQGEFGNPLTLDSYDYSLNQLGFSTGKVVMTYQSTSILSLEEGMTRYFNFKLPSEFHMISKKNGGNDLRTAITASYRLPGENDYTNFKAEEINTTDEGQLSFELTSSQPIKVGQVTSIRVQINFGKILDSLGLGPTFDYKTLIPDATGGGYTFRGAVTTDEWLDVWPAMAATGVTDGSEATTTGRK